MLHPMILLYVILLVYTWYIYFYIRFVITVIYIGGQRFDVYVLNWNIVESDGWMDGRTDGWGGAREARGVFDGAAAPAAAAFVGENEARCIFSFICSRTPLMGRFLISYAQQVCFLKKKKKI